MDDEPVLVSSYGNEILYLEHIKEELKKFPEKLSWDGEIYKHGWPRERIDAAIRTKKHKHPDNEGLEFHIFDYQDFEVLQYDRAIKLKTILPHPETGPVVRVYSQQIHTLDWMGIASDFVQKGYEGIILRDNLSRYYTKRISGMLKFKPSCIDYYMIVGFNPGTGWCEGMLGSFVVQGKDTTLFSVGTGRALTKEMRQYYWNHRESIFGHFLKVKHEPLMTSGSIPLCTVALDVVSSIPKEHEDA
jgi:ATP-dependent DNA ligase